MTGVLYWVRSRTGHTPAHIIARWDGSQAAFMCGNEPEPGGKVITRSEAAALQAHVCRGCTRTLVGGLR